MVAIHQSLAKASDKGKGSLVDIGRSLISTFESLPKNEQGHLEGPAIRYLVHSYFLKDAPHLAIRPVMLGISLGILSNVITVSFWFDYPALRVVERPKWRQPR